MLLCQQRTNRNLNKLFVILFALNLFMIYYIFHRNVTESIQNKDRQSLFGGINPNFTTPILIYNSSFNPFKESTTVVNDIMMAYAHHNFGYDKSIDHPVKKILFWNEAYGSKDYGIGFGRQGFEQLDCPVSDCLTTDDRYLLNSTRYFDAIIFHLRTFNEDDLPSSRDENQRWIFWSLESPQYNMRDIVPLNGLFNWTMTYRLNSDVVQPYGWIQPNKDFSNETPHQFRSNKTKLVAWFVSNCHTKSRREDYVSALEKYLKVDVYGDCGPMYCARDYANGCYEMLQQDYKFYLSFENSYCDDYVTEKLFAILNLDVIPIVFGGANYSAVAPPFSFIDVRNFSSAKKLADYVKLLDGNPDLYHRYFWWKPHYRIKNRVQDLKLSMCGLCARLHTDSSTKIYEDLEKWWIGDSHCHVPRPNNVFRIPFWLD